jgi:hypothetical protein
VLRHGVLNMQETKYGMQPTKHSLRDGMKHGFERICIVYERLTAMVCFYLSMQLCILYYI